MGEMADFVNEEREWDYIWRDRLDRDPQALYDAGYIDELGYEAEFPDGVPTAREVRFTGPRGQGPCPKCGKNTIKKKGKFGEFYGCCDFPDCKGSRSL
jgi:hypothetical protein